MGKIVGWVLSFTKLGKVVTPVQKFLSGKKVYLAAAGVAVPALLEIVQKFSEQGLPYVMSLPGTPEFKAVMEAIAAMGLRAAVTKAAGTNVAT